MQLVDQAIQRGAGGKLGAQLALILQLQAALAQQRVDHVAVVLVLKEAVDLVSDFHADVRQIGQHLRQGLFDTFQRRQRTTQHLGRFLADIGDAQRVDEARQRRLTAVRNSLEQFFAGDFRKTLQINDLFVL